MTNSPQTPAQELAERSAESIPALQAAAAAVGLQDHQRMLRDHARRVRDSHRLGAKAAGLDDLPADAGGDDLGDIIISGDITNTYLPAQSTPPAAKPDMTNATNGLTNLARAAIIGASLLSGGIGGAIPLVANLLFSKPAPAPVATPAPAPPAPPAPQPTKQPGYEIRLVPDK
jgi:hypothetical protein